MTCIFPVEDEFIFAQSHVNPSTNPNWLQLGIGDDAAILRPELWPGQMLVGTDLMVEGTHFRLDWSSPEQVIEKLFVANLSDMEAMGGSGTAVLFQIGIPQHWDQNQKTLWAQLMALAAQRHGLVVLGGDTVRAPVLQLGLTVMGSLKGPALLRQKAQPGQCVGLSAPLGASAAGLELLLNQEPFQREKFANLVEAHLCPKYRLGFGAMAAQLGAVCAMDLSDGLDAALEHIGLQSQCGFNIHTDQIPQAEGLDSLARHLGIDPMHWILGGGEEYSLVLCYPPSAEQALTALGVVTIGSVQAAQEIVYQGPSGKIAAPTRYKH